MTMNNTEQTAAFLRNEHKTGSLEWRALCLKLQRMARGLPAVYPSALAAAEATPKGERIYRVDDLRRGMVAYSDDPSDGNRFGHIYFIVGRTKDGTLLTWSNDVKRSGGVDIVPFEFYQNIWGDKFQFGATWLNGFNFSEFDKEPVNTRGTLGKNYDHAIEDVRKSLRYHRNKGHNRLANILQRDLQRMLARRKNWSDIDD